jgi:hypothetical protein
MGDIAAYQGNADSADDDKCHIAEVMHMGCSPSPWMVLLVSKMSICQYNTTIIIPINN